MKYKTKTIRFSDLKKGDLLVSNKANASGDYLVYTATTDASEIPSINGVDCIVEAKSACTFQRFFASDFPQGNVRILVKAVDIAPQRECTIAPLEVGCHYEKTTRKHLSTIVKGDVFFFDGMRYTALTDASLIGEKKRTWIVFAHGSRGNFPVYSYRCPDGMVDVVLTPPTSYEVGFPGLHTVKESAPAAAQDATPTESPCSFTGEHRIYDNYVLSAIPNAFNDKTSWWISKHGCTVSMYCFSTSGSEQNQEMEAEYQLQHIDSYIRLFERRFFGKNV